MLLKYRPAVALPGEALEKTHVMKFDIELLPGSNPVFNNHKRCLFHNNKILKELITEMKSLGVIEPSKSPLFFPFEPHEEKGRISSTLCRLLILEFTNSTRSAPTSRHVYCLAVPR